MLQKGYRNQYDWDEDFQHIIEAGGFLAHKYDSLADYIFEKITAPVEDNCDYKYFLPFCLTVAAKTSLHAIELLWKLLVLTWPESLREGFTKDENIDINKDARDGLKEGWKLFDVASPEVIDYLLSRIIKSEEAPSLIFAMLDRALGETPNVTCQAMDREGNCSDIERDFSIQVIALMIHLDFNNRIHFFL